MDRMEPLSAYHQLSPVEKVAVDTYLGELESSARAVGKRVVEFIAAGNQASTEDHYQAFTKRAEWNADRILARPLVKAAIHERVLELTRQMEIDAYKVLKETAGIAFSNISDYLTVAESEYGGGYPPHIEITPEKATPEQMRAVQSIKISHNQFGRNIEIKLYNKLDALEKFFKYMGLYDADNRQKAGGPLAPNAIAAGATTEQAADMYAKTLRRA